MGLGTLGGIFCIFMNKRGQGGGVNLHCGSSMVCTFCSVCSASKHTWECSSLIVNDSCFSYIFVFVLLLYIYIGFVCVVGERGEVCDYNNLSAARNVKSFASHRPSRTFFAFGAPHDDAAPLRYGDSRLHTHFDKHKHTRTHTLLCHIPSHI